MSECGVGTTCRFALDHEGPHSWVSSEPASTGLRPTVDLAALTEAYAEGMRAGSREGQKCSWPYTNCYVVAARPADGEGLREALDKHVPHSGVGHDSENRRAGCQRCRLETTLALAADKDSREDPA